jgi:hypothetical protein
MRSAAATTTATAGAAATQLRPPRRKGFASGTVPAGLWLWRGALTVVSAS